MISKLTCFFLLAIVSVTASYHRLDYIANKQPGGLLQKLSGLRKKHGLNFAHIEGMASMPQRYKEEHPRWKVIDSDTPLMDPNTNFNMNEKKFNILVGKTLPIQMLRTGGGENEETDETMGDKSLRICRKEPKKYKCKRNCHPVKSKSRHRSGNLRSEDNADDTPRLLNQLENLLARNGKYNIFLGCVGEQCGDRSQRGGYSEDRDNKNARGEYLGCFGDGCSTNRDDDDDNGVRIYL